MQSMSFTVPDGPAEAVPGHAGTTQGAVQGGHWLHTLGISEREQTPKWV